MKQAFLLFAFSCILSFCNSNGNHHNAKPPGKIATSLLQKTKPTVTVYIENSGSMDGYVKGVTEFEQAVYSYLSDIKFLILQIL